MIRRALPFNRRSAPAGPAWSPLALGSALLAYYAAASLASRTVPGAVGQPVGAWDDLSGAAQTLTTATGLAVLDRPTSIYPAGLTLSGVAVVDGTLSADGLTKARAWLAGK